jgi:signal transduction histidine kinase/AraC-like DNA-binding protein
MRQLLASGEPITAVLASNDGSCLGATEVLQEHRLRIPDDVAIIGFDNVLESWAHAPSLTTVHNPAFTVGQQALQTMLDVLAGHPPEVTNIQIPIRLVIGRSCGCRPGIDLVGAASRRQPATASIDTLARAMAESVLLEAGTGPVEMEAMCRDLVESFIASVQSGDDGSFVDTLLDVLRRVEALDDDAYAWHSALVTLKNELADLSPPLPAPTGVSAEELLDRAHQLVSERARRQAARTLLREENLATRLGLMTSQLLRALDTSQIPPIIAEHLPQLGVPHLLGALFVPDADPVARSEIILSYGLVRDSSGQRFSTRQFPPPNLYPPARSFQLALLPLVAQEVGSGFVVFDAANLEPCGAIVRHLAGALRSSHLYAEALAARTIAQKADRLKTMLLTNVSHDLRTPLNVILGYSQAALKRLERGDAAGDGGLSQDLRQIYGSGEHLLRLINDLLDLSRAEIDELDLLPEMIDTRRFLQTVFEASMTHFGGETVTWQLELPPELPPIVGDPVRLRQVLLNLLHNAHKFTRRGQITLGAAVAPPDLHLWVADTGAGIPDELREQIFEPFVSAGDGPRRREGIGLGLAIARRLVALHRGRIQVESQLRRGSTFHIYLPLPRPDVGAASPQDGDRQALLLITEAVEPPTSLIELAKRRGLALHTLRPGDNPAHILAATQPALLAWDLTTAAASGWDLVEQIRAHRRLGQLPMMLYHGGPDAALDTSGPVTGLLLKPLSEGALIEALRDLDPRAAEGSILIVEDDPHTRALHRRMIAEHVPNYAIRDVGDARAALDVLARETPNLIVLDLIMPEVDGFAVLEALRADPRTVTVPVLVLSGKALSADDVRRLGEARVIFQTKDVLSDTELAMSLRRTLGRENPLPPYTSALVKQVIAFIQQHHTESISLQEIADVLAVSKNYLGRIFHEEVGLTPWEYLIRYRVLRAKELLRTTDYTVAEVAARVGFDTTTYFNRIFRREVGCSPRAFRAQFQ